MAQALPVHAQSSASTAAYDALIDRALAAYRAREFTKSRAYFEQAHAERPSARTWRGLGMSSFELDRFTLARSELEAALSDTRRPLVDAPRAEVESTLAWMRTHLGSLQLTYSPSDAEALVDEQAVAAGAVLLNPGPHQLHVRASGYTAREQAFTLNVQESLSLRIELVPLQPTAAPALVERAQPGTELTRSDSPALYERWWFWAATAALVGGGVALAFVLTDSPRQPDYSSQTAGVNQIVTTLVRR